MRRIAAVLVLIVLVVGCYSSRYPYFSSDEPLVIGHPFPVRWRDSFRELRGEYVAHYHDCDDQAQVYAEYLFDQGVAWRDIRGVSAIAMWSNPITGRRELHPLLGMHYWVEAWLFGEWWIFDPAARKWAWKFNRGERPAPWCQYTVYSFVPGGTVFIDGSGYEKHGDRFDSEALVWVDADGKRFSVDDRTDDARRLGVLLALKKILDARK